ncbi:GNAT family N-acetyltransferase [Ornithinimicrobium pekingense]|uniref:N-acetyltransferase n=1 Tax=Ornithinimicrobium pekingense TaxID=384677 RepID=A0ABQ2F325_9MICO|nr:GNAT family N-acetyltransferase [Ornithinimicrobium pekingense]GGK55846.1 N-acetyltransferase [Ornithinimicrobium pekingense]
MSCTITARTPTPQEHRELAESVGWGDAFWWDAVPTSLAGSVCGVVVHDDGGELVGMGRVVGDGAFYFYVQDVVVRPDHQGAGLGRDIVEALTAQVRHLAPGHCFVGLFATPAADRLYRSLGWDDADLTGMWTVLRD